MQLGIFAKTFLRDSIEANLDAVRQHGFSCTQYNLVCAGLPMLPEAIEPELCERIRQGHDDRGLSIAAISGTFNVIDGNRERLEANIRRLRVLAEATSALGTDVITLCSGTRDPQNMWQRHPDNDTPEAWRDVIKSMRRIVALADEFNVTVAVEPEVNNVVDSAVKARRLLDEIGSPNLKIVLDAANLFHAGELNLMRDVLDEAFALVGGDIVIAHAKDLNRDGDAGHEAAGAGLLDYDYYLHGLRTCGFEGPLIAHNLTEEQAPECAQFLRKKLSGVAAMNEAPARSDGDSP